MASASVFSFRTILSSCLLPLSESIGTANCILLSNSDPSVPRLQSVLYRDNSAAMPALSCSASLGGLQFQPQPYSRKRVPLGQLVTTPAVRSSTSNTTSSQTCSDCGC